MNTQEKLSELRNLMTEKELDAYIIPPTDPHQSEYVPEHYKTREWLSGFNGSAGTVVVTHEFAGLWTDSRYFLQAEEQLKDSGIELVKLKIPHTPEYIEWINETLPAGSTIGIDGKVFSQGLVTSMKKAFTEKSISVVCTFDLPGMIWHDRPTLSTNKVYEHETRFAGKTRDQKLELVRKELKERKMDYQIVTALDEVAWLFNLRGTDVDFNPVFIAYSLVGHEKTVLFINREKLSGGLDEKLLAEGIEIEPYEHIYQYLNSLAPG